MSPELDSHDHCAPSAAQDAGRRGARVRVDAAFHQNTPRFVVRLAAVLLLVAVPGCRSPAAFRRACVGLRRGTPQAVVRARLESLGAEAAFVNESWFFHRSRGWFSPGDVCETTFDRHDRLTSAHFQPKSWIW